MIILTKAEYEAQKQLWISIGRSQVTIENSKKERAKMEERLAEINEESKDVQELLERAKLYIQNRKIKGGHN